MNIQIYNNPKSLTVAKSVIYKTIIFVETDAVHLNITMTRWFREKGREEERAILYGSTRFCGRRRACLKIFVESREWKLLSLASLVTKEGVRLK